MTCVRCAGSGDCLETSHGTMCRPCFQEGLKHPPARGPRLFTLPTPGQRVWVVTDPQKNFITVNSTLYGFERREDAVSFEKSVREGFGLAGTLQLVDAHEPLAYVMRHGSLRFVTVKEIREDAASPEPGSVRAPF